VQRLLVSHGGRVTMKVVGKEFSRELKAGGDTFRAALMDAMKALTRRVLAPDGVTPLYMLKGVRL
jgi:hypothetical protein